MDDTNGMATSPRGALSNAGWNAFVTVWTIAVSVVLAPLLIHRLGTAQYGLLLLVWSVTGLLGVANLGVGEATLRYVSHYHSDGNTAAINRVFGSTLLFYMLICLAVSTLVFHATPIIVGLINMPAADYEAAGRLLRLAAVLFSIELMSNAFRSIPMALQRYDISGKIGFGQSSVRAIGFAILAVRGVGVLGLVLWDVLLGLTALCLNVLIASRLLPRLRLIPRVSLAGLREIFGYGVYSFLTHLFLMSYRESGKLILGNHVGPSGVAYLGTPDSIAYRVSTVIISAVETLMPRFSANRNAAAAEALVVNATRAALTASIVLFTPLATLMPDLLRLWIDPEFARESGAAGQLLAMSFIGPAGFSSIATFYRGTGRPGFVTAVMALVGLVVVGSSALLVPQHGALGAGYAYVLGAVAWLAGLLAGWLQLFGAPSMRRFLRAVGLPLLLAAIAFGLQMTVRSRVGELDWTGLFALGTAFSVSTCVLVVVTDWLLGGESLSKQVAERLSSSGHVGAVRRRIELWQAR